MQPKSHPIVQTAPQRILALESSLCLPFRDLILDDLYELNIVEWCSYCFRIIPQEQRSISITALRITVMYYNLVMMSSAFGIDTRSRQGAMNQQSPGRKM